MSAQRDPVEVLLTGLSSPKGLAVGTAQDLIVAQGAFGPPGPVLSYVLRGRGRGVATPVTEPFALVDVAISPRDGTGWAISSATESMPAHLYHQLRDDTVVDVLDFAAYQAGDPDELDQDQPPNPTETNAYGLTVNRRGEALVADAAGNDLIRVSPEGNASTVARFDIQTISTDHLPPDFPLPPDVPALPPTIDAEAVPTTVTIGPDGAIYVGELKGFPFRPGSSNIWRIEPDATDAFCSLDTPDPDCTLYDTGFTAIQDIAFDRHGDLLVYELTAAGVLAFEAGFETGEFPPATLLSVSHRRGQPSRVELAAGLLSEPGGIVADRGDIYVTDGVFTGGRLLRVDDH